MVAGAPGAPSCSGCALRSLGKSQYRLSLLCDEEYGLLVVDIAGQCGNQWGREQWAVDSSGEDGARVAVGGRQCLPAVLF